jgi:perosamine synthetase
MSYLAPAGTVMSLGEIAAGFARGSVSDPAPALAAAFAHRTGVTLCEPISSGRAAMTLALESMRELAADPRRDEVIIPAYTCYSVAASVVRAGLRPRLCDVDPHTFGMDPAALRNCDFGRVLAVISANLYGIPNALPEIEAIARERGVFMLDDSAQALGARIDGRAVGTFGDAGLYSFDKGKILCTIQGGIVLSRHPPLAAIIQRRCRAMQGPGFVEAAMNAAKLPVYAMCIRPALYGAIRRLPFLGLGRTEFETRYPITRLGRLQSGLAQRLFARIDMLNATRVRNAQGLAAALEGLPGIELPAIPAGAEPVYARFAMRVRAPLVRERLIGTLDADGIGATASYPLALADVPEITALLRAPELPMPGARQLAAEIVTLPTHGHCPPDLGSRIRSLLAPAAKAAYA